jgi:Glycosyl hydrolase family 47
VLESNFYAWRATADTKYLDRAASAIKSFQTYLKAPAGYAGILDVNNPSAGQIDDTESFWYAEVLKYLCDIISLDHLIVSQSCDSGI